MSPAAREAQARRIALAIDVHVSALGAADTIASLEHAIAAGESIAAFLGIESSDLPSALDVARGRLASLLEREGGPFHVIARVRP